ncbi:MAG TPA: hypothetical protein P5274_03295 [Candidatus Paceibacterota bacterium]|nr:hypothetical protein [Candidatus Paceibacterota bacterium]
MVLTPHAVVGASIASIFKLNPFTAFFAGFLSHFFMDSVPHWDYKLRSARLDEVNPLNNDLVINRESTIDFIKIGFDAFLGLSLSLIFFTLGANVSPLVILAGALGAILPDPLQVVYVKYRREPFLTLQKTHMLFHTRKRITNPVVGVLLYCLLLLVCLLLGGVSFFIW